MGPQRLAEPGVCKAISTGEEGAQDQLPAGGAPPASPRRRMGWVQNTWAANVQSLGEAPRQRSQGRCGSSRALRPASRSVYRPPQPSPSLLWHRMDRSGEATQEGAVGGVPRWCSPMIR